MTATNFYGDSQRGTFDFNEAGINANWIASKKVNVAGQLFTRDAGSTDNGKLIVDYLFIDYQAIQNEGSGLGIRLGRVRNALGFYNEIRDVLVARPSIFMPQSVYFEGIGMRELLFASEGAQIYSYWDDDSSSTTFSLTMGRNESLPETVVSNLLGNDMSFPVRGRADHPVYVQLAHNVDGGRLRFAVSTYDVGVNLATELPGDNRKAHLDSRGYVGSAQYNTQNWSFTAEYSITSLQFYGGVLDELAIDIEGSYLQTQYRLSPEVTLLGRYEYSIPTEGLNNEDTQRLVLGTKWSINQNWTLAVDLHGIRGDSGIPPGDNPNGLQERTELLAVMIGYRF